MPRTTTPGTARGVTTLMYVGDAPVVANPPSSREVAVGVLGAALALFGNGVPTRAAGAGVAAYVYARSRGMV